MYELLLFPNSWPKNLGAAYTRANTVYQKGLDNNQSQKLSLF
jgi:hypothetical protein